MTLIFSLELERAECEFLTGALTGAADERLTALSNQATSNTTERATLACLHMGVCAERLQPRCVPSPWLSTTSGT